MLKIKEIPTPGFQKVIEAIDSEAGLHAFVAIHNLTLGPALGGTRMYPYHDAKEAFTDALHLAEAMTYKSAVVEDGLGGGKSVIIGDPSKDKSDKLWLAFGEVLNYLEGKYIAAEDVGTCPEDLMVVRRVSPYVAALPTEKSSGDPSYFTAWGIYKGMQAVAQKLWGNPSLKSKRIAIQGVGHVGSKLAGILFWEGADLILSDINEGLLHDNAHRYGAEMVPPVEIHRVKCDIFSPCALGGILNDHTVAELNCPAVAGAANNQLAYPEIGFQIMERGILYAPDYVINAGGIINTATEFEPNGYNSKLARDRVNRIYERLLALFDKSEREHKPTNQVADEIAEYNLQHQIGKRAQPLRFQAKK